MRSCRQFGARTTTTPLRPCATTRTRTMTASWRTRCTATSACSGTPTRALCREAAPHGAQSSAGSQARAARATLKIARSGPSSAVGTRLVSKRNAGWRDCLAGPPNPSAPPLPRAWFAAHCTRHPAARSEALLRGLVCFDPSRRWTVVRALQSEFFHALRLSGQRAPNASRDDAAVMEFMQYSAFMQHE